MTRLVSRRGATGSVNPVVLAAAIEEASGGQGRERIVGANGEINAGSRREMLSRYIEIAQLVESGRLSEVIASPEERSRKQALRREKFEAAWNDPTGRKWAELGAEMAADISSRVQRMAFGRRLLVQQPTTLGGIVRIRVPENNVRAVTTIDATQVGYQLIRGKYVFPTEVNIVANPRVSNNEVNQGGTNVLDDLYSDMQQAILVGEDRLVMKSVNLAAGMYNSMVYYTGQVTPTVFATLQEAVNGWGYQVGNMLVSMDLMKDINTGSAFTGWLDPVSKLEVVLTGRLGTALGMTVSTDGYRDPNLRVLDPGSVVVLAPPENLGAYTDRGPVVAEPRTNDKDFPGRGFFAYEQVSFTVANGRAVSVAKRI